MALIHLANLEGNDLVFQTWSTLLDLLADIQKGGNVVPLFQGKINQSL